METVLVRQIQIPMIHVLPFEAMMRNNGINVKIVYGTKNATVEFYNDADYLAFVLKDLLTRVKDESGLCHLTQPDFDFMIRLEKKLKTYSKGDEYHIRKALKGK